MNQIINTNRAVRVKFNAYTSNTQTSQSSNASIYMFHSQSEKFLSKVLILILALTLKL